MSDLDGTTISIDDLRSGHAGDVLAEADVVFAVDENAGEEEVVYGRHEWELATATGHEEDLVVVRVELDMEAGELEWLVDKIEALVTGEMDEPAGNFDTDEDDDD